MIAAIDFESFYAKDCDISSLGAYHYLSHPKVDVYLVSIVADGFEWVGHPKDFEWARLDGAFLVAHNMAFDGLVLAHLTERGIVPPIKLAGSGCTANLAAFLGAPRNLAGAAKQLLGLDVSKDLRTWMKGKTWADAVGAGRGDELREYALRDARACFEIWKKHSASWPAHEQELARLTMLAGWRGLRVDTARIADGIRTLDRVLFDAAAKLPWSDSDSAILSPKALGEACRAAGITPPPSLAEDDPACEAWEKTHGDKYPWVGAMRDYRKANALREKLKTMQNRTRATDGCMSAELKYFGGHTGRWSGSAGFNYQNLPRGESYGVDIRSLLMTRKGYEFVICDLSQIEPRILGWLCGDQALLDQLANGVPLYQAHAIRTMGWRGGVLKKENPRIYGLAKARVLGLGYGCGPEKFVAVARIMGGIEISLSEAERVVQEFRSSNRPIVALWNRLQTEFRRSANGDYEIELPSGRLLVYRNVSSRGGWTAQTERGGPRNYIYGGKICENLCQSVARDVFADALLRLHRAGINVVFHVHDEVICEVPIGTGPEEIERLMSITPNWLPGCPLAAEAVVSNCYCK